MQGTVLGADAFYYKSLMLMEGSDKDNVDIGHCTIDKGVTGDTTTKEQNR
jgi:hypothetical protein